MKCRPLLELANAACRVGLSIVASSGCARLAWALEGRATSTVPLPTSTFTLCPSTGGGSVTPAGVCELDAPRTWLAPELLAATVAVCPDGGSPPPLGGSSPPLDGVSQLSFGGGSPPSNSSPGPGGVNLRMLLAGALPEALSATAS